MNETNRISIQGYKINFWKISWELIGSFTLFISVLAVCIFVLMKSALYGIMFIMVLSLLAFLDFLVFNSQIKTIIQQYKQTKVFCLLLVENLEVTADDEENIRMISFGQIKNMLLGKMKSLDGMQFFRIRFKGSRSDIYFTTEDNTKETFDDFTMKFVKQVDEFNGKLLPSQKRIVKKLVNMKPENILQS